MIEAFLARTPAREIARWTTPRVAHNTISRYMRARVTPALRNAAQLLTVDPPRTNVVREAMAKDKTERKQRVTSQPWEQTELTQEVERRQVARQKQVEQLATEALVAAPALSLFRQRLEKLHDRVDKALERADSAVRVVDRSGNLVAVGADLSPLAPLLSVAHKNLEMLGRATGELEQQGIASMSIQIVCPSNPTPDAVRISFASNALEAGSFEEVGLIQRSR